MRTAVALGAIVVALALQTRIGFLVGGSTALDLVVVVVVYAALAWGPTGGLLLGAAAGLAQDTLSGGVIGVGGLAKTIVGYLTGVVGAQFIVSHTLARFTVFFVATAAHGIVFIGVNEMLGLRRFPFPVVEVVAQSAANGFVGTLGFQIVEFLPVFAERRRAARVRSGGRRLKY